MTTLDTILKAVNDARRALAEYISRVDDFGKIMARDGCYVPPQIGTQEDLVLNELMAILNNAELLSAMRTMARRSTFRAVDPNSAD